MHIDQREPNFGESKMTGKTNKIRSIDHYSDSTGFRGSYIKPPHHLLSLFGCCLLLVVICIRVCHFRMYIFA